MDKKRTQYSEIVIEMIPIDGEDLLTLSETLPKPEEEWSPFY